MGKPWIEPECQFCVGAGPMDYAGRLHKPMRRRFECRYCGSYMSILTSTRQIHHVRWRRSL